LPREFVQPLAVAGSTFDLVFADAFKDCAIAFHLATVDIYRSVDELLAFHGLVLHNVSDDLAQPLMLATLVATVNVVHVHVPVLSPSVDSVVEGRNTSVIASSKGPGP
jgi:spermidine synthase